MFSTFYNKFMQVYLLNPLYGHPDRYVKITPAALANTMVFALSRCGVHNGV